MNDQKTDKTDNEPLNPFPDESWIGCPHCEKPIDICAQIARARVDVAQFVLSLLFNDVPVNAILHPLELLVQDCLNLEENVRRSYGPLSHLNVYGSAPPRPEGESLEITRLS